MERLPRAFLTCLLTLSLLGCKKNINDQFPSLEEEYIGTTLSFSPTNATAQGYHTHMGADLDGALTM